MKKILSLMALLLMASGMVHAQYMLKVQLKNGMHDLFEIDCTDKLTWESDFMDPNRVMMMVYGRKVGLGNRFSLGYYTDNIEQMTIISSESVAPAEEQNTFELDEHTASVNMVNYSIEFGPCVIDGKKTLTVNRIDNAKEPQDLEGGVNYMTTYDFDLEGIHDLKGVVEICFPVTKACYAAYLNEETGEWVPVLSYYDAKTSEMVIITDHLSTYSVFDVTDEHKRTAKLVYSGFDPTTPTDIDKVLAAFAKVAEDPDPDFAAVETFANDAFAKYSLGLGIGMTPIQVGGFDLKLINGYSDLIGHLGTAWSILQFANTLRSDDDAAKATGATKLALDLVMKFGIEKKLYAGNFLFPVCMTALAVLDWEINWFGTTVHETATTLYQDAYNKYFKAGSDYPSKQGYGYRSAEQWYDLINGFFTDRDNVPSMVTENIDRLVTEYVNQPWDDSDGFNWAVSDSKGWWPFWVEISDKDRRAISENHRKELYSGTLKSVIQNINRKYLCKTKEKYDEAYRKYAEFMNKSVALRFKDSSVRKGEKSKFSGCKIKFEEMPTAILDPEKWECVIDDNGQGLIAFRLYPYLYESFKPELVVVDEKEGIVGNIDIEGIQDVGKYLEATFDLSDGNVLTLEDKWNITLTPLYATGETTLSDGTVVTYGPIVFPDSQGFEEHAVGIVPGDILGIYRGITDDAFGNRQLNIDAEGNFTVQNPGLNMTGHINTRTGYGTGKFTLKTKSHGSGFITENEAFDDWCKWSEWVNNGKPEGMYVGIWTEIKKFDADFSVDGTFEIQYSELMNNYSVHLDGIGTFDFEGEYYFGAKDAHWERTADGKWFLHYQTKNMMTEEISIDKGTIVFSPTLIFQ